VWDLPAQQADGTSSAKGVEEKEPPGDAAKLHAHHDTCGCHDAHMSRSSSIGRSIRDMVQKEILN